MKIRLSAIFIAAGFLLLLAALGLFFHNEKIQEDAAKASENLRLRPFREGNHIDTAAAVVMPGRAALLAHRRRNLRQAKACLLEQKFSSVQR